MLFYPYLEYEGISDDPLKTYAILKSDGDMSAVADLYAGTISEREGE
ncbi:MAG: hypothetical protein IH853_12340 [Bacteroidetes bacterium]|nr:hypothetical protein [Bacteroidota bacterium]